ncbi:MAG: aminotransferase class I/II-fold pyridoxal phosphate-dependent enzyme [Clostridia bacterium]|nr:aminotransferase class I/II-fold pyridoxal phosphate-dependent enzyme [Clostridia bacterium]
MREHLNPNVFKLRRSSIREFSNLAAATPGCIRLTLGEPEFQTPAPVFEALHQAEQAGETHYIANNGALALRERIARFEREQNGLTTNADEIIVTAGATEGLMIALTGILAPGDEVVIPTPAFVLYEELVKLAGGVPVPLDTTPHSFQIRQPERVFSERTKAVILNTPNNPTGVLLDEESLQAVRDAVAGKPIFVICDDVYRQLVYTENYHSFTEFADLKEQIILIQSYSKPYAMTGWRLGYLIAHPDVKERLELIHQFSVTSTPSLFQRAGIAALEVDPTPFVEVYRKRRDYAVRRLREMGLKVTEPQGAFYVFPCVAHLTKDDGQFCRNLIRQSGVALTPGSCFGAPGYIRLSYCCSDENLQEGLDRLERFIRENL